MNNYFNTRLLVAAREGRVDELDRRIRAGGNIGFKTLIGNTPLIEAVRFGHEECVKRLLTLGADPTEVNNNGDTLLHIACRNGRDHLLPFLVKHVPDSSLLNKPGVTALILAIQNSHVRCVERLADLSCDLNTQDGLGHTPLHWAATHAQVEIALLLLSHGALPDVKNPRGFDFMAVAVSKGHTEFVARIEKYFLNQTATRREETLEADDESLELTL